MTKFAGYLSQVNAELQAQGGRPNLRRALDSAAAGLGIDLNTACIVHSADEFDHIAKAVAGAPVAAAPKAKKPAKK